MNSRKVGVDCLRLCRLGKTDPRPEIMCRLLHYALISYRTKRKDVQESEGEPSAKESKKDLVMASVNYIGILCHWKYLHVVMLRKYFMKKKIQISPMKQF